MLIVLAEIGKTVTMHSFYEDINKLFDFELYDDVITLYELSYAEQVLSNVQAATVVSMVAESYYQRDSFIKSQEVFLFHFFL